MLKKFNDYDTVKGYADVERLPKGGYICKILSVEKLPSKNGGEYLKIALDVAEGEYKDYFMTEYKRQKQSNEDAKWRCNYLLNIPKDDGTEQDGWTKRSFKTFTNALEDSNTGYHFDWDETKFKGKLIGGLFNEREYEGRDRTVRRAINFARAITVEKIRTGDYKIPDDKLYTPTKPIAGLPSFENIPDNIDDELPFN